MKKKLVILGSGFGAFSCLKRINLKLYDVDVVSPRNHFLFTPLLPSTTVGTIEFRSIIEPIRNIKGLHFYQAECTIIDHENKSIECVEPDTNLTFSLKYDLLLVAVGEITNTFGIEGVKDHAYFLREVADARKIRIKVIDCFENASLPNLTTGEKKDLLRFIVCGGGPTGVEFAAELHDFIEEDVNRKYPELKDYIEEILIEAGDTLLNSFDIKLSNYTLKIFKRQKINVMTKSNIVKVSDRLIYLSDGTSIEYGLLVWATGNTATPLLKSCSLPKNNKNKLLINNLLQVEGFNDIYSLGDCRLRKVSLILQLHRLHSSREIPWENVK